MTLNSALNFNKKQAKMISLVKSNQMNLKVTLHPTRLRAKMIKKISNLLPQHL